MVILRVTKALQDILKIYRITTMFYKYKNDNLSNSQGFSPANKLEVTH